jgi:hypothetical protein
MLNLVVSLKPWMKEQCSLVEALFARNTKGVHFIIVPVANSTKSSKVKS